MAPAGANASVFFNVATGNLPDKNQLKFALVFQPGVADWTGPQVNSTKTQVCKGNNLNAMGDVNVINWDDQFRPMRMRLDNFTGGTALNFGVMAAGEHKSVTAAVNGFKTGDAIMHQGWASNTGLKIEAVRCLSDNVWTITAQNVTAASGTFNGVTAAISAERV